MKSTGYAIAHAVTLLFLVKTILKIVFHFVCLNTVFLVVSVANVGVFGVREIIEGW